MRARPGLQSSTLSRANLPALVFALLLTTLFVAGSASAQSQRAVELTEGAAGLIAEQDYETAIRECDKAIEEDGTYWKAWFERGRALAMSGRMQEGKESLLRATELSPGNADAHRMAALAAQNTEDYEVAWDQAIRAYLAGANPQTVFGGLSAESPEPPDFDERVNAWKVYVAGIDTRELVASAQGPDNTRGRARGTQEALVEIQPDLVRLQRHVAVAISDSHAFGLVQDPAQAQYYVTISPEEIDAVPRPAMNGQLRLYRADSTEPLYYRAVTFRDLSSEGQVLATLQQVINHMANWRREQQR
jgi:tetratricopeptide (TPR) repeat protein